jgi:hypothetical protein
MKANGILIVIIVFFNTMAVFGQIGSNNVRRLDSNSKYIINRMYFDGHKSPIGWSRDGKFAIAYYFGVLGSAGYIGRSGIDIMNTITDEVIERYSDDDTDFQDWWIENETTITDILQRHNIISFPDIEFQNIDTLKQQFSLEIEYESIDYDGKKIQDNENYKEQNHIDIYVRNSSGRRKKIGKAGNLYADCEIMGFYISPFENRLVFYVKEKYFGGPSISEIYYKLIGCHTTVGF